MDRKIPPETPGRAGSLPRVEAISPASSVGNLDPSPTTRRRLRNRSLVNLLKMGHCAPTVMQTMLDVSSSEAKWLVKLTAGLPGGIGNTGLECGGITAPLILLGLRLGAARHEGLPLVFYKGHDLWRRFLDENKTFRCLEIRGEGRLPLPCIGVIRHAPELYAQTLSGEATQAIAGEQKEAYARLYSHFSEKGFHCAHCVFGQLGDTLPVNQELLDASSAFVGGTLFKGITCSAFTAGVMALGLKLAEIENSPPRVLRMIALMAVGGDAFADDINKFNRIMNLGNKLSQWFVAEFSSTQCRAITQSDFSTLEGVDSYIEKDGVAQCRVIAEKVAARVREMLAEAEAGAFKSATSAGG